MLVANRVGIVVDWVVKLTLSMTYQMPSCIRHWQIR
jgi:hypothetical protein